MFLWCESYFQNHSTRWKSAQQLYLWLSGFSCYKAASWQEQTTVLSLLLSTLLFQLELNSILLWQNSKGTKSSIFAQWMWQLSLKTFYSTAYYKCLSLFSSLLLLSVFIFCLCCRQINGKIKLCVVSHLHSRTKLHWWVVALMNHPLTLHLSYQLTILWGLPLSILNNEKVERFYCLLQISYKKTCKYGLAVTTLPPPAGQLRTWLSVRDIYSVYKKHNLLKKNNTLTKCTGFEKWNSMLKMSQWAERVQRVGRGLHHPLRLSLSCNLLGTLQQSVVNIFGTWDLRLDHAEVLCIRHGLRLHCVRLGGCWDQVGRMFGAVNALGETLICQSLHKGDMLVCVIHCFQLDTACVNT